MVVDLAGVAAGLAEVVGISEVMMGDLVVDVVVVVVDDSETVDSIRDRGVLREELEVEHSV